MFELDPTAGFERAAHRIGVHRLDPDDLDAGLHALEVRRDAGDQPAAADRHEYGIDRLRRLAQDFDADRALPRDHIGVVVRMDEGQPAAAAEPGGERIGFVVRIAVQDDAGAARDDRVDLDLRRGDRHDDRRAALQALRGECHALGVIARRRRDDTALQLRRRQLRHLVIGAAQLEGEHGLHVLALEQQCVADALRQRACRFERRLDRDVVDARAQDALEVIGLLHQPSSLPIVRLRLSAYYPPHVHCRRAGSAQTRGR